MPNGARGILQVVPSLDAGGAERTALDVSAALAARGMKALVASDGGRLVTELEAAGGRWLPFPAATKNPARILANAAALARIIRREEIGLVHARSRAPAWSALLAARAMRVPFVTTYHGAYNQKSALKGFYNGVMARGDVVIANSRYTERLIHERHPVARGRTVVIHRGTDLKRFDPKNIEPERVRQLLTAWGVAQGRPIVLLAARLTAWKGQRILIESACLLKERQGIEAVFVLAGDAQGRMDYVLDLERRIAEAGLQHDVKLVGHCADMPAALAAASVLCVPSTEPEAFGRSAVEAQAMGVPVVVSDHGAVPETVLATPHVPAEERTGWRVPPGDAEASAAALAEALALHGDERSAISSRARAHVCTHFGLDQMIEATLAVYDRLMVRRY